VAWLQSRGYVIHAFDTAEWKVESKMHDALQATLSFPAWYGKYLNALNDCMWEDLVVPENGGLTLVLSRYDHFVRTMQAGNHASAEIVLDIFARAIRYHSLLGKRLLVLVQSDDPKIQFGRLGGISATWNLREWLNQNRGL